MPSATDDLLAYMQSAVLPKLPSPGFRVVEFDGSYAYDARVVIQSGDLRIVVDRDRGLVGIGLGSSAAPNEFFSVPVFGEHLGLPQSPVWEEGEPVAVLDELIRFVQANRAALDTVFAAAGFGDVRKRLKQIQLARVDRMTAKYKKK
jgi:hypothetical protein